MSGKMILMALFEEKASMAEIVADTLDHLRQEGVAEADMAVLSDIPVSARILGRPMTWERLPWISLSGALVGLAIGLFLNAVTPQLYPIRVGGQPLVPLPPTAVITFEFTMMGLIVSTFLGVLWESTFPSFGPKRYDTRVTAGYTGILFRCSRDQAQEFRQMLKAEGADDVTEPEEWTI